MIIKQYNLRDFEDEVVSVIDLNEATYKGDIHEILDGFYIDDIDFKIVEYDEDNYLVIKLDIYIYGLNFKGEVKFHLQDLKNLSMLKNSIFDLDSFLNKDKLYYVLSNSSCHTFLDDELWKLIK